MEKSYSFDTVSDSTEKILSSSVSTLPKHLNDTLSSIEKPKAEPTYSRNILGLKFRKMGVNSNPFLADRATRTLLSATYILWTLTFMFLLGAAVNFLLLEKVELSATSHDARIEATATPVRVRGLE